jgi:hypothetical protein
MWHVPQIKHVTTDIPKTQIVLKEAYASIAQLTNDGFTGSLIELAGGVQHLLGPRLV